MPLVLAHHVAVELFGREYSPQTVLDHVCAFTVVGLILATSAYGTWTIAARLAAGRRVRRAS